MSSIIGKLRGATALAAFVFVFMLVATPQLYALLAWHRLTAAPPVRRRKAIARWQSAWGVRFFAMTTAIMGVRADFRVPADAVGRGPVIVVANHRSSLDILVLFAALARTGRADLRWIIKRQLFFAPTIGRSCRETGCAYVARGGDPQDISRVRLCAARARHDGASVVIFPEGTRFTSPRPGSGYANVLPPKIGGVLALRRALPDCHVLSVTISWTGGPEGRTMFDGESFVGKTVVAECALHTDVDDRAIASWLQEEWRRKDRAIAACART
uniref:Acyltransferase n=1 Tax=uncultured bacterium pA1 TaxID=1776268 RepID=A0A0U3KA11_9BACT|nr:acyltransferase [uncultured bacterium pA1]